jgi:hypothetical protein
LHTDGKPIDRDEPEVAAGELARRCGLCRAPIAAEFFIMRSLILCPDCAGRIVKRHQGQGRRRRAELLGLAVAAVVAVLWFLASRSTGRPLSPLALAAGLGIGLTVHQGSGGRGGLRYQIIAVLLVYAAFVVRYVPPVFSGIADAIKEQHGAKEAVASNPHAPATAIPAPDLQPEAMGEAMKKHISTATPMSEQNSVSATLKAYFVFSLVAWGLVLAAPFMPGTSGFLGILFLAAGMALAWRLNRRVHVLGPFPSAT